MTETETNSTGSAADIINAETDSSYEYLKYIGGRKFSFALCIVIFATILLAVGMIDKEIWKTVVLSVSSMYMISNVVQKQIEKTSE